MPSQQDGPSIVLIGGEVTLDTGARIDTRQQIQGDPWDFTLRSALGESEAFWERAKELSDLILQEAEGDSAWALAWVNKTVKRPKSDGTFTRLRTVTYLDNAAQLNSREHFEDSSRTVQADAFEASYRIMPYLLRFDDMATTTGPKVVLGAFHTTYEDGTDIIGLRPLDEMLSRWPNAVLILPHTPLVERKAQGVLDWWRKGAPTPKRDEYGNVGLAENTHPQQAREFVQSFEESAELRAANPYLIEDDLRVTFWVDHGEIRNPADLEAAITFVKSRYDLTFGVWDLARDKVLRSTLLDPEDTPRPNPEPVPVPSELRAAGKKAASERDAAKEAEAEARLRVHEAIWPHLRERGWEVPSWHDSVGYEYHYPIGPRAPSPFTDIDRAAVYFALVVHKKQIALHLFAISRIQATEEVLAEHADRLNVITGGRVEPNRNVILRLPRRGWDGDVLDWADDSSTIDEGVRYLLPHLDPVVQEAVEIRTEQAQWSHQEPHEIIVRIGIEGPIQTGSEPRPKGLLKRLLGR